MRLRTLLSEDSEVQAAVLGTGCRHSGGKSRREEISCLHFFTLHFLLWWKFGGWGVCGVYWIKHVEQLQAVQEHAVIYLFLNCRAALNSVHTAASDSLQFIPSDLKSFYLPQLFRLCIQEEGWETRSLISTNKASFYSALQLYLPVFLTFRDSHNTNVFKTNTSKRMLSRLPGVSLTYFFPFNCLRNAFNSLCFLPCSNRWLSSVLEG